MHREAKNLPSNSEPHRSPGGRNKPLPAGQMPPLISSRILQSALPSLQNGLGNAVVANRG